MKTEDVPLHIKEIFDKKNVKYNPADIARMRYLCRELVKWIIEFEKEKKMKICIEVDEGYVYEAK